MNTAVGAQACLPNTSGGRNTAVGLGAMTRAELEKHLALLPDLPQEDRGEVDRWIRLRGHEPSWDGVLQPLWRGRPR